MRLKRHIDSGSIMYSIGSELNTPSSKVYCKQTDESYYAVRAKYLCNGCHKLHPKWRESPPSGVVNEFHGRALGVDGCCTLCWYFMLHIDMYETMKRIGLPPHVLWMPRGVDGHKNFDNYVIYVPSLEHSVHIYRGIGTYYKQCKRCGHVFSQGIGKSGILRRVINGSKLVCSSKGWLHCVPDTEVVDAIRAVAPDVRLYPTPVIDEPADGYILPGDPGWDGTLRHPATLPDDDEKPKRNRKSLFKPT